MSRCDLSDSGSSSGSATLVMCGRMPAICDASVIARPTPLWEHMTFSILLHENPEIKGFLRFNA